MDKVVDTYRFRRLISGVDYLIKFINIALLFKDKVYSFPVMILMDFLPD